MGKHQKKRAFFGYDRRGIFGSGKKKFFLLFARSDIQGETGANRHIYPPLPRAKFLFSPLRHRPWRPNRNSLSVWGSKSAVYASADAVLFYIRFYLQKRHFDIVTETFVRLEGFKLPLCYPQRQTQPREGVRLGTPLRAERTACLVLCAGGARRRNYFAVALAEICGDAAGKSGWCQLVLIYGFTH